MSRSRLDLVLAGTEDAVMMIEGFGDFLTVDEMLYAIEKGHEAVANACREIGVGEGGWPGQGDGEDAQTPDGVDEAVEAAVGVELAEAMAIGQKQVRGAAVEKVRNKAMEALEENYSVRVGRSGRDAIPVAPIRFRFFFFPVATAFTSVFVKKKRFSRPTTTARTHRRAPVAFHSWSRRRRAQLPRAQIARHEYFERALGPPRRRTRELPMSSLCTYPTSRGPDQRRERALGKTFAPSLDRSRPSLCGSILSLCSLVSRGARLFLSRRLTL